jgi:hypothetical protein
MALSVSSATSIPLSPVFARIGGYHSRQGTRVQ